jgi:FMN phosphatase YigB (HAD superfamily)
MTSIQKSRFARSPLTGLVAGIAISEELGVSKPRPELFLRALEPLSVAPRDALMIGDGIGSDIRGANNAGIDACWYKPSGNALPEGVHAAYVISDIRQCVEIALG